MKKEIRNELLGLEGVDGGFRQDCQEGPLGNFVNEV